MGKDLQGKELGKGFSQRKGGLYEARAMVSGKKIDLYDMNLSKLKKAFEIEKSRLLRDEKNIRPKIKFGEWYTEWFEKCKSPQLKSDVSKRTYNRRIKNTYGKLLFDKELKYISQINLQQATFELTDKGYVDRTIKEALGIVRECLDAAVANQIILVNPAIGIKIKETNIINERRVMTVSEQKIFLQEAQNRYYYEAYQFLLLTGMRIGEFSGLQWGDIDFTNKVINIRQSLQTAYYNGKKTEELTTPKTQNSYRKIPFFPETEECLIAWKKKQESCKERLGSRWRASPELGDLVWTSLYGSPVTRYVLSNDINKIVNDINLKETAIAQKEGREPIEFKHLHPHAFRHTFATRCLEKGLDSVFVQNIMGHANYSTTLSYTHILEDLRKREIAKIDTFLN
jgi:integrase